MTITISDLVGTVSTYLEAYPDERAGLEPLLAELGTRDDRLLTRAGLPGHVTCSAAVLDGRGSVLMVEHRALDMWLIPGGHIEPRDDSLLSAALRELNEETGVHWPEFATPVRPSLVRRAMSSAVPPSAAGVARETHVAHSEMFFV